MTIQFRCTDCNRALKTKDRHAGAKVKCPGCGTILVVPVAEQRQQPLAEPPLAPAGRAPKVSEEEEESIHFLSARISDEGIDMTPMVDVTFLLLIFFMVTAAYNLQKSIEVPPPDKQQSAQEARTLEDIEKDDDYVIIEVRGDNTVWVNEREAPSRQELLSILREAREGPAGTDSRGPTSVLVLADGDAWHETVVMALDAGNAVGMENVRLASFKEETL